MYVGLKNYGSTGFLNTLVQVLFHIPAFRRRIYEAKTQNVADPGKSIPLALQKLFYQLQTTRDGVVEPKELTRAFGWSDFELRTQQHDIVEFFLIFMEQLTAAIAKLPESPSPRSLFDFETQHYISCLNVAHQHTRTENEIFVAAPVAKFSSLTDGLQDIVASETLDGDNQYRTDAYGMQDAIKGIAFTSVPPVLVIQLKRFDLNFETFTMEKIFKRYEFATELDMAPYFRSSEGVNAMFDLHAVVTHLGTVSGGSYATFIRSATGDGDEWFKFSDDKVTKESQSTAVEGTFGTSSRGCAVAYVLFYIKREDRANILREVEEADVPEHIKAK